MILVHDNLWLCQDCTIYACNGDLSGIDDDDRARDVEESQAKLPTYYQTQVMREIGFVPHLVPHFDSETGDGIRDFSWDGCDSCEENAHKGGELHRFALLGLTKREIKRARRAIVWGRTPEERAYYRRGVNGSSCREVRAT